MSDILRSIADSILKLSLLDAAKLVQILEADLNIPAGSFAAAAVAPAGEGDASSGEDAVTKEYVVVLKGLADPSKKLSVIKAVREKQSSLSLIAAKSFVEDGGEMEGKYNEKDAKALKEQLETAGAIVELK